MDDPIAYVRSKLICHGRYNQAVSELDDAIGRLSPDQPDLIQAARLAKLYCLLRIPEQQQAAQKAMDAVIQTP